MISDPRLVEQPRPARHEIVVLAALVRDLRRAEKRVDTLRRTRRTAAQEAEKATGWPVAQLTRAVNQELQRLQEPKVSHDTIGRLLS